MNKRAIIIIAAFTVLLFLSPAGTVSAAGSGGAVTVTAEHGSVINVSTGAAFPSGTVVGSAHLIFVPDPGYEFLGWAVDGSCEHTSDGTELMLSSVSGDVSVKVSVRNYSPSQEILGTVDVYGTPTPGDGLVNAWSFMSTKLDMNTSGSSMVWNGMPSCPLIVGDIVYVRAGGIVYGIDIESGTIKYKTDSIGKVDFFHYLGYGNGVIFDPIAHKAYDLELKYLYDLPSNLVYATYHDGFYYGCLESNDSGHYTLFKTTTDKDKDLVNGTKTNLFQGKTEYQVHAHYGQFSGVVFKDGYFFFLESNSAALADDWKAITAVNLATEKSSTLELPGFYGLKWDDGWISYNNGYFYITAYAAGLFDTSAIRNSSICWFTFDFDTGTFGTPEYDIIRTADGKTFKGIASGFEIHNNRGYVNARALDTSTLGGSDDTDTYLVAYDIGEDGRPIPTGKASSPMTHGGIVVNTAYESEGKIYIYLLPYNAGNQGVFVYVDELIDGKWVLNSNGTFMDPHDIVKQYCSQPVRVGPSGELVYYTDSGYTQCIRAASTFPITVTTIDGGYASVKRGYGGSAGTVLEQMFAGSTLNGSVLSLGTKTYTVYGLNEVTWTYDALNDPYNDRYVSSESLGTTNAIYSQIALVAEGSEPNFRSSGTHGWYYFSDDGIGKCELRDRDSLDKAVGTTMVYSDEAPSFDMKFMQPFRTVARGSSVEIEMPEKFEFSYSVKDSTVVSVSDNGKGIVLEGVKEDTTVLTISVGGRVFDVTVEVTPKVTVDGDRTITESVTSRSDSDGGRIDTEVTVVRDSDGSTSESIKKIYGPDGSLVSSETMTQTHRNRTESTILAGQYGESDESEKKVFDASGGLASHTRTVKETILRGNQDASNTKTVIEAVSDEISKVLTIIQTDTVSNFYCTSVTVTKVVENDGKQVSRDMFQTVESSDKGTTAVIKDGTVIVTVGDGSEADIKRMVEQLDGIEGLNVRITAAGRLTSDMAEDVRELKAGLVLGSETSSISLGPDAVGSLGSGDLTFTVGDAVSLSSKQKAAAGDAKLFDIVLTVGGNEASDFGKFSVSIACDIPLLDGKPLQVWRIDRSGATHPAENVVYTDGVLTFQADHLSVYAVGYMQESHDSSDENGVLVLVAVVCILAIIGAVLFVIKRAKARTPCFR